VRYCRCGKQHHPATQNSRNTPHREIPSKINFNLHHKNNHVVKTKNAYYATLGGKCQVAIRVKRIYGVRRFIAAFGLYKNGALFSRKQVPGVARVV
jgi:hypothetical protein